MAEELGLTKKSQIPHDQTQQALRLVRDMTKSSPENRVSLVFHTQVEIEMALQDRLKSLMQKKG